MTTIGEILKDVGFADWQKEEKKALSQLMCNAASHKSSGDVTNRTDRVLTTFLKILDTHLPEKEA